MTKQELETCALALYWGEGAKSLDAGVVDLANGDPSMLQVFLRYLREVVRTDESRIRVYLYCFADQDVEALKCFWSEALNVPLGQFTKPYVRVSGALRSRRLSHGVAHVRYNDKKLLLELLKKIERIKTWAVCRAVKRRRL